MIALLGGGVMFFDDRSFGDWLRRRRRALDFTQEELASQVGCAAVTLRKLEAEERRPSKQVADRLADVLQVAAEDRAVFLRFARGDPFAGRSTAAEVAGSGTTQAPRHNLPTLLSSFIGRERELTEIRDRLAATRLLTLTGPGGVGKTRLAIEAAQTLTSDYPHGVWLVELAALADPTLVSATVAAVIGVGQAASRPLLDALVNVLKGKHILLVLDNCEHLLDACARLAEQLVQHCPQLRLLATSREAFGVAGEEILDVPPLALPAVDEQDLAALEQSEAVRLFIGRAVTALPEFALTSANASAVAQVCRRLDGVPLALELAAARVSLLRVEQIATRLEDAFRILTGGSRTALPRQQTLRATLDWSYDLLTATERAVLRRLAVFAGGWTLEAAEAVVPGEDVSVAGVLDTLTQLVRKSLVVARREPEHETRYRLLEMTRQYALERLLEAGETEAAQRRHALYYRKLYDRDFSSEGDLQLFWMPEFDNLRAALTWNQTAGGDADIGLVLASLRAYLAHQTGRYESPDWLETALSRPEANDHPQAKAWALLNLGTIVGYHGDLLTARTSYAESLALWRDLKSDRMIALVLERLGWVAREQSDWATARRYLEESLAILHALGDFPGNTLNTLALVLIMQEESAGAETLLLESLALGRKYHERDICGWALNHLGHVALLQGDCQRARQLYRESLAVYEAFGTPRYMGVAHDLHALGEAALAQNLGAQAVAPLWEALRLFRDLGERAGIAWCLAGLAGVAVLEEDPERAARLWGAAEALLERLRFRSAPAIRVTHQRLQQSARDQLGSAALDTAWAEGRGLSMDAALSLALESD